VKVPETSLPAFDKVAEYVTEKDPTVATDESMLMRGLLLPSVGLATTSTPLTVCVRVMLRAVCVLGQDKPLSDSAASMARTSGK